MGFIGGGSGGFIGGSGGKVYKFKRKYVKTLAAGANSFVLDGVIATDVLSVCDHYGVPWTEPDHYVRAGANLDTVNFTSPMLDTVTFTIYVYE